MLPSSHPLIEAVTEPLTDNPEHRLAIHALLEHSFDAEHPSVPEALTRLEAQDKKKFPALGKIAIWCMAAAALGFSIYADRSMILLTLSDQKILNIELAPTPLPAGLTQQERLLIGDPELDVFTQKQQLFQSDPTNPAYFAEYVQAYQSENDSLPPDFLETAARIDPDNSFFVYWAAGSIGKEAVEMNPKKGPASRVHIGGVKLAPLPTESEYTIKDQAAYEEALAWFKKASELPKYESYADTMMIARSGLIEVNDFVSYMQSAEAQYGSSSNGIFSLINLSRIIEARAEELSKKGNKDEFLELVAQRDKLLSKCTRSKNAYLLNELIISAFASATTVNFEAAAKRLELTEMAETYRKQNDLLNAARDRRRLPTDKAKEKFILEKSSIQNRLMLPMVAGHCASPPPLTDADLKPSRMAEHELVGRLGILSNTLILLVAALFVFLFRFLAPKVIRFPAKRIACLLRSTDWLWIFSLGIVLPILVFLYINRLSPVSGRDYGSSYFLMMFPGLHLCALLLTLLLAPAIVTRWRLTHRAATFKFGSKLDLLALPVIGVMLIYAYVAYPVLVNFKLNTYTQIGLAAPLVGWLGFIFFNGLRILLGSARSRLIQSATFMAVIPAYPLAIIALCLTLPLYHQGEKYWLPQDELFLINPDSPDIGAYEFRVAAQMRKEINAILGME